MEKLNAIRAAGATTLAASDIRRNIAIMAHIDAGKTTLTERMLWKAGAIRKPGEVHDGAATMDSMAIERERGITISSAAISFAWGPWKFALIDTPGHVDFSMEVERGMRAVDGAVLALCAVSGAQTQTESVWRRAAKAGVRSIIAVNKMDREGADFDKALDSVARRLGANPVAVALPVGSGSSFEGAVDLVGLRLLRWSREGAMSVSELEGAQLAGALASRSALVERLGELGSEAALEWFVEGVCPTADQLWAALRQACLDGLASPAVPASAFKNQGVELALEVAGRCLPAPSDRGYSSAGPFSALVFKTEAGVGGQKVYARVASGSVSRSDSFEIARGLAHASAARMASPMADGVEPLERARAGDVVVFEGLRGARTGDTLRERGSSVELERVQALAPVVGWQVVAASKAELPKVLEDLARLCVDDPSLRLATGEAGECVLWGQGDLHLEVALDRLEREFGVKARAGAPEVAYAYRLRGPSGSAWGSVDKQTGGKGQYAKVELVAEPAEGTIFVCELVGEAVPRKFVASVERGARAAMEQAGSGAFPILGWRVALVGGQSHAVDSSEMAFERAGFEAAKAACEQAGLELMEPMGKISAELPADGVGAFAGEVAKRGGRLVSVSEGPAGVEAVARAPMSRLFGFVASMRSLTAGRARATTEPDGFEASKPEGRAPRP
jgi:elongation factor G